MGRRRYSKRVREQEGDSLIETMLDLAWHSTAAGAVLTVLLFGGAGACYANPRGLMGLSPLAGFILILAACFVGIVTLIGFLRRSGSDLIVSFARIFAWIGRAMESAGRDRTRSRIARAKPSAASQLKVRNRGLPAKHRSFVEQVSPSHPSPSTTRHPLSKLNHLSPDATKNLVQKLSPGRVVVSSSKSPTPHVKPGASSQPQAIVRDTRSVLSKGEMAFYLPLREIVAGRYEVHVKQSLVDVLDSRSDPRWMDMARMHVDFLLCDIHTLRPCLAIELDDRSHRHKKNVAVDKWKEELLSEKGIPFLRQPCERAYDIHSLKRAIEQAVS